MAYILQQADPDLLCHSSHSSSTTQSVPPSEYFMCNFDGKMHKHYFSPKNIQSVGGRSVFLVGLFDIFCGSTLLSPRSPRSDRAPSPVRETLDAVRTLLDCFDRFPEVRPAAIPFHQFLNRLMQPEPYLIALIGSQKSEQPAYQFLNRLMQSEPYWIALIGSQRCDQPGSRSASSWDARCSRSLRAETVQELVDGSCRTG